MERMWTDGQMIATAVQDSKGLFPLSPEQETRTSIELNNLSSRHWHPGVDRVQRMHEMEYEEMMNLASKYYPDEFNPLFHTDWPSSFLQISCHCNLLHGDYG